MRILSRMPSGGSTLRLSDAGFPPQSSASKKRNGQQEEEWDDPPHGNELAL
jgi:hypothetical protein